MAGDSVCGTCQCNIAKGSRFVCHGCQLVMHWTARCTGFSDNVLADLEEVRMNILLLCNNCAMNGTRDEIISRASRNQVEETLKPELETIRTTSEQINLSMKNFEKTASHKINDATTSIPNEGKKERAADPLSIRIRGVKECNKKEACDRLKEDSEAVSDILESLIARRPQLTNVKRLGKYDKVKENPNICRPLLVTFANQWDKRLILSSLSKLKGRRDHISISRDLSSEEVKHERELLKERYRLINEEGIPRDCIRIFNFTLQRKGKDGKWQEV